jgi:hypothetical protein
MGESKSRGSTTNNKIPPGEFQKTSRAFASSWQGMEAFASTATNGRPRGYSLWAIILFLLSRDLTTLEVQAG